MAVETVEGSLDVKGRMVAVVVARWNEMVTKALTDGAVEALVKCGAEVRVIKVPGTWEVPVVVRALAKSGKVDGIVALGCILQGATAHAGLLASGVGSALMSIQLETGVRVSWGILTPENQDQAIERAGMKHGNAGREAALACVESITVLQGL